MQVRPDAAGMRLAASQIRSKSDRIGVVLSRLDAQIVSMTYAGPAADQFRATMADEKRRLTEASRILAKAADVLIRGAANVEADPLGFYGSGGRA